MHTVPELLEAAAIRLSPSVASHKCVVEAFAIHGRPIRVGAFFKWRCSDSVPRNEYAAPLAQMLGVDPGYVMECLIVARRRGRNYSGWDSRAKRDHVAASIASINAFLAKAADEIEREGRAKFLMAQEIRTWAKRVGRQAAPNDLGAGITVHSVIELIYALDGKLGSENDAANANAIGVIYQDLHNWRRGRSIPSEKHAVSLGLAIGIDFLYVLDCLALARGEPIEGNGPQNAAAIRTVNLLLVKAAKMHEEKGLMLIQEADKRRARLREM